MCHLPGDWPGSINNDLAKKKGPMTKRKSSDDSQASSLSVTITITETIKSNFKQFTNMVSDNLHMVSENVQI